MRLNDLLPTSIEFRGETIPLDLAFDNILDMFDVLSNKELMDIEKASLGLELLAGDLQLDIPDQIELWELISREIINVKKRDAVIYDQLGNPMPAMEDDDEDETIDWEKDHDLIFASFMQTYGINLIDQQGKMHWWEFQALMQGLSPDSILQRVIQIRLWQPRKGDSAEYKNSMKKLQDYYRIGNSDGN